MFFFFGLKYDENNEPIVNDGSVECHLRLFVATTKNDTIFRSVVILLPFHEQVSDYHYFYDSLRQLFKKN